MLRRNFELIPIKIGFLQIFKVAQKVMYMYNNTVAALVSS